MSWHFWLGDKTVRKFSELPIYCQRQQCSPWILVSSKVRFIWIFAGVCWREGVKWEWGRRKWRFLLFFARCIFRTLTFKAIIIILYCVAPSGSLLTLKRMTFNDLEWSFCVKIWFGLGIQWVGILAFGEYCWEICRATHILSAATKT